MAVTLGMQAVQIINDVSSITLACLALHSLPFHLL
jgi:hypothetical protein